jgi:hypothetical protein
MKNSMHILKSPRKNNPLLMKLSFRIMTKLKELVKKGLLLNNEEIYFDWNEFHFIARVRSNGDYLET